MHPRLSGWSGPLRVRVCMSPTSDDIFDSMLEGAVAEDELHFARGGQPHVKARRFLAGLLLVPRLLLMPVVAPVKRLVALMSGR